MPAPWWGIADHRAVGAAREDDREFLGEFHEACEVRVALADVVPRGFGRGRRRDSHLPLAVIAEPQRLEDRRRAYLFHGGLQFVQARDSPPRRGAPADRVDEGLLARAVLRDRERASEK